MELTEESLAAINAPLKEKKITIGDGLYIHLRTSGKKIFVFRFQWQKLAQTITIGRFPAMSLAQAKEIAANFRAALDNGIDPRIDKHKVKTKAVQKNGQMAAFIDSFLDYLLVVAPHIPMLDLYDEIKAMYFNKLHEYNVVDMLESDLKEVAEQWRYSFATDKRERKILKDAQVIYAQKRFKK